MNGIYRDEKATEINKMLENTIESLEEELNYLDERRMELTLDPIEEREKEFSEILKNVGDLSELEIDINIHAYISDIVGKLRNILYRDYEEVPLKVMDESLTHKRTRMDRESAQIWLGTTVKPLILQGITIQREISGRVNTPANTISQRVKLSYRKDWSEYVELVQQGIL